jgi:hypothetical protein
VSNLFVILADIQKDVVGLMRQIYRCWGVKKGAEPSGSGKRGCDDSRCIANCECKVGANKGSVLAGKVSSGCW